MATLLPPLAFRACSAARRSFLFIGVAVAAGAGAVASAGAGSPSFSFGAAMAARLSFLFFGDFGTAVAVSTAASAGFGARLNLLPPQEGSNALFGTAPVAATQSLHLRLAAGLVSILRENEVRGGLSWPHALHFTAAAAAGPASIDAGRSSSVVTSISDTFLFVFFTVATAASVVIIFCFSSSGSSTCSCSFRFFFFFFCSCCFFAGGGPRTASRICAAACSASFIPSLLSLQST